MVTEITPPGDTARTLLRGTPVVPGVAYAPALLVHTEVSPDAVAAFDPSRYADAEEALEAYDAAVEGVADGFARKAAVPPRPDGAPNAWREREPAAS